MSLMSLSITTATTSRWLPLWSELQVWFSELRERARSRREFRVDADAACSQL